MRATMRNVGKAEFMSLFHQYQSETLCAKKFQQYANQIQDPSLKNLMNEFSNQCQQRSQWLSSTLSEAGGGQFVTS